MQTDFPSAVYWYTSVVISITVSVIIGIVNRVMDEKINRGKAVNILVATIVFVVISYLILFYGIGKIFLLQGEFLEKTRGCSSAVSAYQVAVRWLPSSGEAQIRFARCMSAVKQFDNALRILDSLEEKENSKYTYWWARSIIYFSKGDYKALSASTESML